MFVQRAHLFVFVSSCIATSISVSGCGLVAGLKDNIEVENGNGGNGGDGGNGGNGGNGWMPTALPAGFMDSRNALCSDGTNIVDCESAEASTPGQDGHYLTKTPEFEPLDIQNPKAFREKNTNLIWWYEAGTKLDYLQADTYCKNLGGGYHLPSRIELITILEYNGEGETLLDETVFKNLTPGKAWTSSPHPISSGNSHWVIDLCTSCQAEEQYVIHGSHNTNQALALCVNGPPLLPMPLLDSGGGILFDPQTSLQWFKNPNPSSPNGLSWLEALEYCQNQNLGMYEDWRLPTIKELQTLIKDETSADTCLDPAFGAGNNTPAFWSSTPTSAGNKFLQLTVQGCSTNSSNESYFWATCVRNKS